MEIPTEKELKQLLSIHKSELRETQIKIEALRKFIDTFYPEKKRPRATKRPQYVRDIFLEKEAFQLQELAQRISQSQNITDKKARNIVQGLIRNKMLEKVQYGYYKLTPTYS